MKKKYTSPLIISINVSLEETLSNGSVSFTIGGEENEPLVENWTQETLIKDLEF